MLTLKREKRYSTVQMLLAAVAGALVALATGLLLLWAVLGPYILSLGTAWGLVQTRFVGEYDPDRVVDAALEGMVAGTGDRWSYYLNAEGYAAQNERRNNSFVGVGVTVLEEEEGLRITEVYENAPAEKAGLTVGEVLTAVDGVSLAGKTLEEGVSLVQGEAGTSLTLTVKGLDGKQRQVELHRAQVENSSVTYELLEDKVGYIRVKNFYTHSADQVEAAVEQLREQGAEALLFDMRNNGGGYVDQLTKMLDHLLPEGPIFRSESRTGRETVTHSDPECVPLPMATLVNADTYSAAEFFAAQLQESIEAPIVGEKTSGKGYSQQAIPLPNGGALNLSTGRYRTGDGVSLIGTGVRLDKEIVLSEEENTALFMGTLEPVQDPQLQGALELLKK